MWPVVRVHLWIKFLGCNSNKVIIHISITTVSHAIITIRIDLLTKTVSVNMLLLGGTPKVKVSKHFPTPRKCSPKIARILSIG